MTQTTTCEPTQNGTLTTNGEFMKKLLVLTLTCLLTFSAFAAPNDILPAIGNTGIRVVPAIQNGVKGSIIQYCNFDQKLKKFNTCSPLATTKREFFTNEELTSIQHDIYGEIAFKTGGMIFISAIVGAAIVGTGGAVFIGAASAASAAGAGIGIGATIGSGLGFLNTRNTLQPILEGGLKSDKIIIQQARFNAVFNVLKEKLDALE